MPSYKLYYFNFRGRAELTRFLFAYAGVEYEDFRFEPEDWPSIKPKIPLGFVPALEVDGRILCQSKAIARYVAREFHLDGETNLDKAVADMVMDYYFDDILRVYVQFQFFENDEEKKAAAKKLFFEEQLPSFFDNLEKVIKDNPTGSGFFAGNKVTWADIGLATLNEMLKIDWTEDIFAKHEKLKALNQRVVELPNIAKWIANRPQTAK